MIIKNNNNKNENNEKIKTGFEMKMTKEISIYVKKKQKNK